MIEQIPIQANDDPLPDPVHELLDEAEKHAEKFYSEGLGPRYYRYVPSDPVVVYRAMEFLHNSKKLRGRRFCELGCGFGIAAGMADILGFDASGIEWEDELIGRARQLHDKVGTKVNLYNESYLPEGYEMVQGMGGKDLIVPGSTRTRGDVVIDPPMYSDIDPGEVDLFFVYPWPDEEELMRKLFIELATEGSVLLMYQGEGEISAWLRDESGDEEPYFD